MLLRRRRAPDRSARFWPRTLPRRRLPRGGGGTEANPATQAAAGRPGDTAPSPPRRNNFEPRRAAGAQLHDVGGRRRHATGRPFSVGAHTVHHEILSALPDGEVANEIRDSIVDVRSRVRCVANSFAYPNGRSGDFDDR